MSVLLVASAATNVETFVDKAYQNAFMTGMHKLRQNKEYTDVTLESGDVQIQCHRNVLAVASDSFKAMFRSDFEESKSASVQMTMEPDVLSKVVDYIYTGEIELTADNVKHLLIACDVLQLNTLKTACESFMVKQVEPVNCIRLGKFSALYQLKELQKHANRIMKSEFKYVAFVDEFKELSCSELIELIKDDGVNVEDEDVVFESVLRWVQHDLDARKAAFEVILEHVRLPYCSRNFLGQIGDKVNMLTAKCFKYIHEAMAFQADTVHQQEKCNGRTVPRHNYRMKSSLLVVGGMTSSSNEYKLCHYYDEDKDRWELMTELPQTFGRFYSVCRVERGLLLTGGNSGGSTDNCWVYDIAMNKWETMPPLTTARFGHRSVSLGECVYVMGGFGVGGKLLASVECLNMKRRQWATMPDLPYAVYSSMATTYDNKVFVFGGGGGASCGDTCYSQVFDVTSGTWSTVSVMPEKCIGGAAVTLNGFIYVVGGGERTCLKYHPVSDSWAKLSKPVQNHGDAPAVVWRGSILVAGGGERHKESSDIEAYHPATDTWSVCSVASMNEKLTCHCMFTVDLAGV